MLSIKCLGRFIVTGWLLVLGACGGDGGSSGSSNAPTTTTVAAPVPVSVLTYHYDNSRSGWSDTERTLTPANVSSASFGVKRTVALDDQVDGQPLVVSGLTTVGGHATNGDDVVYVATENDTVYAIDGATGTVLASRNLGTPIVNPLGCHNNGANVGINSTPVIDPATKTIYVMAYVSENGAPAYRLHAMDVTTLQDTATTLVAASHSLTSGKAYVFDATVQRQRAALLVENGIVYASFASFCDYAANRSRGWILGWSTGSLTPLAANRLINAQETGEFYLSSIWMSGSGLASYKGDIVAVTGNSNPNGTSYNANGGTNYAESIIRVAPDLSKVVDWFTPSNLAYLESVDYDFGAGGIVLLPGTFSSAGSSIGVGAAAGKDGTLYAVNMDSLGHGGPVPASPAPIGTAQIGFCWCTQSAFVGSMGPRSSAAAVATVNWATASPPVRSRPRRRWYNSGPCPPPSRPEARR